MWFDCPSKGYRHFKATTKAGYWALDASFVFLLLIVFSSFAVSCIERISKTIIFIIGNA